MNIGSGEDGGCVTQSGRDIVTINHSPAREGWYKAVVILLLIASIVEGSFIVSVHIAESRIVTKIETMFEMHEQYLGARMRSGGDLSKTIDTSHTYHTISDPSKIHQGH